MTLLRTSVCELRLSLSFHYHDVNIIVVYLFLFVQRTLTCVCRLCACIKTVVCPRFTTMTSVSMFVVSNRESVPPTIDVDIDICWTNRDVCVCVVLCKKREISLSCIRDRSIIDAQE
jgi:hypothetical protein